MTAGSDSGAYVIAPATPADIPELVALQRANLIASGGALSVEFSSDWFARSMAQMPVMIARRDGRLVGYLVSSLRDATRHLALAEAKYHAYAAAPGAYNSGPLCVADTERGKGLAPLLFEAMSARLPGREAVGFVRQDNAASRALHRKLGFLEAAAFRHAGTDYFVVVRRNGEA